MIGKVNISAGEVVLVVIALASKKGKIQIFSEGALYRIFQKLTAEFPDYFSELHWRFLVGGSPYCGAFEDILFRAGDCLLRTGTMMNDFVIEEKTIKVIEEMVKKHHGQDALNKMDALVDRFIELYPKK